MYIIRDIFKLRYGTYKDAKKILEEGLQKGLLPETKSSRVLTDFTGDAYRLIFEVGYESLADYEHMLNSSMQKPEWKAWYSQFKGFVESSHREILKEVI